MFFQLDRVLLVFALFFLVGCPTGLTGNQKLGLGVGGALIVPKIKKDIEELAKKDERIRFATLEICYIEDETYSVCSLTPCEASEDGECERYVITQDIDIQSVFFIHKDNLIRFLSYIKAACLDDEGVLSDVCLYEYEKYSEIDKVFIVGDGDEG